MFDLFLIDGLQDAHLNLVEEGRGDGIEDRDFLLPYVLSQMMGLREKTAA